jgi:hypothetical protein
VPALELFKELVMPRLADGPKTLAALDVPLYAMKLLERAGLVRCKTHVVQLTTGKLAIQVFYRTEDFPAPEPVTDCAALDFESLAR